MAAPLPRNAQSVQVFNSPEASNLGTDAAPPHPRLSAWTVAPWFGLAALVALWPRKRVWAMSEARKMSPTAFEAAEPGRGRAAASPGKIPTRGWRDILWRTWKETGKDRLQIVAAGVTFYVILALFPAMGAFVSLYGLFSDVSEVQKQLNTLSALLPPGAVDLIGREMVRLATSHQASLSTAFVVSLLLAFWSANSGMKALFDGLNIAYDETEKRGFIRLTLQSYAFTVGALIFMLLVSAVMVGGPLAIAWLALGGAEAWWLPVVWLLTFAVAVSAFSVLYRFGPSREHPRWRWVTWGGVLGAVAWFGGSATFSAYVGNFAHYDKTYGSLGAFVGFMVWLWFSILVILLGAELNSEIEHQTAVDSTTGAPQPMGQRGAVMADTVGLAATDRNKAKIRRRPQHLWAQIRDSLRRDAQQPAP
jgi:membrane protein